VADLSCVRIDREDEKAFLEQLQESISKGTTWERITDLVDLQNSRESCSYSCSCTAFASQRAQIGIDIDQTVYRLGLIESKTLRASVPGGSDLARMKEILLSLRREGDKAPAAGGY
jgi:hypothetical protein